MFVKSLREDFYNVICGKQCLILVNFDIDAICASKILQSLFKNDNMVYTLIPVRGIKDMIKAYEENAEEVTYVLMINCGGTVDLAELLQPAEDVVFYILDSHRPFDLCNVYSERQIRIIGDDAEEDIPEYNDIFNDDDSDDGENDTEIALSEDENEDDPTSNRAKRLKIAEERALKRREINNWKERRANILFNYTQYSYYGKSSAVAAFELSWKLSKDNLDLLWWAIIGATEQSLLSKVENRISIFVAGRLQAHVSRLTHVGGGDSEKQALSAIKVTYDKDLQLALYRHWTVEDSLRHSTPTAVALRLWSIKGEQKLKQLFADMGLPLAQSKQRFSSMDLNLRNEFKDKLQKLAGKYNLDSIIGASFTLQCGYRFKYCASDVFYAMLALLETQSKDKSPNQCFLEAAECLSRVKKEVLDVGIENAKNLLCQVYKTAQHILETKQVINAGTFVYVMLPEGVFHTRIFSHPHALLMLADFILKAYVNTARTRRAMHLPLVLSTVYEEEVELSIIAGIPPVSEDQPRSLFGRAFEQAAKNTNSLVDLDFFDTTIALIRTDHRLKFFDALAALLNI